MRIGLLALFGISLLTPCPLALPASAACPNGPVWSGMVRKPRNAP
jgi:hypothetical protein